MKALMITGPNSNSGKTIISLGLIRALKKLGYNISPFKTGPDFVDTKYLSQAANRPAGNLDLYLMGEEGIRQALAMDKGDLALVEGAMGYFDGIHNSYENSSYHISKELDIPAILVYRPKGEMFSAVTKIKGMVDFKGSKIQGVILNKVSKGMYQLLKEQIERHVGVKVLGYLPWIEEAEIKSEILGLELSKKEELLDTLADKLSQTIFLKDLIKLAQDTEPASLNYPRKRDLKIALAYDKAFCFYYRENIRLLEEICQVKYFSPLYDRSIPEADLIYFGAGYPQLYKNQLAENREMIKNLRERALAGQHILAESAGIIYLAEAIEDVKMAGLIQGKVGLTDRLDRFGYVDIELTEDCLLGKAGHRIKGQEFHKTMLDTGEKEIFKITKPMSKRSWVCGYKYKNILAYFQNINFLGNKKALEHMLNWLEEGREEKDVY